MSSVHVQAAPCSYPSPGSPEPDQAMVFTANDANRLKARIDEDPDQAVLLLEQTVAGSLASLTDEKFEGVPGQADRAARRGTDQAAGAGWARAACQRRPRWRG